MGIASQVVGVETYWRTNGATKQQGKHAEKTASRGELGQAAK
jgi:hypothetical protein